MLYYVQSAYLLAAIAYWGFMKSGAKYELFRLSQALGEVLNPTINGIAINTRLILRVYGLPRDGIHVFSISLACASIAVSLTGFDFEGGKGTPLLIFTSVDDLSKIIATPDARKRAFVWENEEYTVHLARVHLRRSKHKLDGISFPNWPSQIELKETVRARIASGEILTGKPLPSVSTRDVLLPGGVVVVGERLVRFSAYPTDLSDIEVCYNIICNYLCFAG